MSTQGEPLDFCFLDKGSCVEQNIPEVAALEKTKKVVLKYAGGLIFKVIITGTAQVY